MNSTSTSGVHSVSRRTALAGLGASSLALAASRLGAAAQEATSATTASPLVGMWQWNSGPLEEPATFAIFHADGTYTEWQPVGGGAIGIWRSNVERTADLLFVFVDTDPALDKYVPGTATFTITLKLDETGDALAAEGTVDVRDTGGMQLAAGIPWSRSATRVTFETNPATGSIPATPAATPNS